MFGEIKQLCHEQNYITGDSTNAALSLCERDIPSRIASAECSRISLNCAFFIRHSLFRGNFAKIRLNASCSSPFKQSASSSSDYAIRVSTDYAGHSSQPDMKRSETASIIFAEARFRCRQSSLDSARMSVHACGKRDEKTSPNVARGANHRK